jgi:hypothetical protein
MRAVDLKHGHVSKRDDQKLSDEIVAILRAKAPVPGSFAIERMERLIRTKLREQEDAVGRQLTAPRRPDGLDSSTRHRTKHVAASPEKIECSAV